MTVTKFKTALINVNKQSKSSCFNHPTEHLGIAYIASYARLKGICVEIIDGYLLNLNTRNIFEKINKNMPNLVGITCEYNTFTEAIRLSVLIKKSNPNIIIVLGGEHATYAYNEILKEHNNIIDIIVRGEGEITFAEICKKLSVNKNIHNIKGIAFYNTKKSEIVKTEDRPAIENIDNLPHPARDMLEKGIEKNLMPAISVLGSRGCPNNCNCCNAHKYFNIGGGAKWRPRSPENIIHELKQLLANYKNKPIYPVIYFADENFAGNPKTGLKRIERFARLIIENNLNISYEIFCRTDTFNGREDIIKLLKKSGLISVLMGIEAGSNRQLNGLKKGTTINNNEQSIKLFEKHNIITSSSGFLMFNPYSQPEDLIYNANFLLKIQQATLYNMSCRIHAYPGIQLAAELKNKGMLKKSHIHYKVDEFRFINKNIELLANLLNRNINIELMRREDSTMRNLDLTIATIKDYFKNSNVNILSDSLKLKDIYKAKKEAQLITHNFFINLVEISIKKQLSKDIFLQLYKKYTDKIKKALSKLDNALNNFLLEIENKI
jgi:anaerobic magnesium-protoporphyrin IX monomethyl ester cyclase